MAVAVVVVVVGTLFEVKKVIVFEPVVEELAEVESEVFEVED